MVWLSSFKNSRYLYILYFKLSHGSRRAAVVMCRVLSLSHLKSSCSSHGHLPRRENSCKTSYIFPSKQNSFPVISISIWRQHTLHHSGMQCIFLCLQAELLLQKLWRVRRWKLLEEVKGLPYIGYVFAHEGFCRFFFCFQNFLPPACFSSCISLNFRFL